MNPLGIAVGIILIAVFLLIANALSTWFGATQIQLVYIAITVFGAAILIGAFGRD